MWWPCSIITGGRSRCSGQRVPLVNPMGRLETRTSMRRAWFCMSPPQPRAPRTSAMLPCQAEAVSGTIRFVRHTRVVQTSQFLWMGSLWLKKQPPAQRRHVIGRLKCFNHTAGFSFDPVALIKCEIAETELRICVRFSYSITQTTSEHFCGKWRLFSPFSSHPSIIASAGVRQSGRGSAGRGPRGSDELAREWAALSMHRRSVHHSEFAAGGHPLCCECSSLLIIMQMRRNAFYVPCPDFEVHRCHL